jgi:hypothetical protein
MEFSGNRRCSAFALAPCDRHAAFVEPHDYTIHVDEWLTDTRKYINSLNNHVEQRTTPSDTLAGFPSLPKRLPN